MGKGPKSEVKVHCKRELMHAVWSHLMDEEFMKGYTEGLKIQCADGIDRMFFLRLLTYSANYPKK
jgi:metal-dependent HD superfamily phosphatase/phosphodiesterase